MTSPAARPVEIDSTHSVAICREIGQRLDRQFKKEALEPSPQLDRLVARLRELDRQDGN